MSAPPPTDPRAGDLARKKFMLTATVVVLVVTALLFLLLPARIPKPLRILVAGTDLLAALILWVMGRQRYGR